MLQNYDVCVPVSMVMHDFSLLMQSQVIISVFHWNLPLDLAQQALMFLLL